MKKSILLATLLLAGTFSAMAQFEIRPLAGLNFSNVSETPDGVNTQAKVGYQVGANVLIGNNWILYPGIQYFQRNTEFSSTNPNGGNDSYDQEIGGVIIPILGGFRFLNPDTDPFINFRIMAGPSISFLTKTTFSQNIIDDEIDWKSSVWGGQVGAGLDVSIFFLDVNYEFGLSKNADASENASNFNDIRNNTFYISAGVRLKLAS